MSAHGQVSSRCVLRAPESRHAKSTWHRCTQIRHAISQVQPHGTGITQMGAHRTLTGRHGKGAGGKRDTLAHTRAECWVGGPHFSHDDFPIDAFAAVFPSPALLSCFCPHCHTLSLSISPSALPLCSIVRQLS